MAEKPRSDAPDVTPLGNYALIELIPTGITEGGLHLPQETAQSAGFRKAVVLRVGSGRTLPSGKTVPPSVKPGQSVILPPYVRLAPVKDTESRLYAMVDMADILGVKND